MHFLLLQAEPEKALFYNKKIQILQFSELPILPPKTPPTFSWYK